MKILLAVDGSAYSRKALAYLATHEGLCGASDELVVLHVQAPVPPRVKTLVGAAAVRDYHREEAEKVLAPVERFLKRHDFAWRTKWVVGAPGDEIVALAQREKAQMIVMGTHGRGFVGRVLMGSVAHRVLAASKVPVLLVK
jgi:nucleotide-binding universal stress UspA family protein